MEIHSRMLIITGTYPPQRCGVGDYTQRILSTSAASSWSLFYQRDWQLSNLGQLCRKLKSTTDRVVCLQYPTMGYGTQITPHLLAFPHDVVFFLLVVVQEALDALQGQEQQFVVC